LNFVPATLLALALAGCGGGGIGIGTGAKNGPDLVDVTTAVGIVLDDWLVVDLTNGAISPRHAVADLATNPVYRDSQMVFRRIRPGLANIGSPAAQRWAQADEIAAAANPGTYFIGALKVTRAQWRRIAYSEPWNAVTPAALAGPNDDNLPACGVSLEALSAACSGWNRGQGRLEIPSEAQWEIAARGGTATMYSWGNATDEAVVGLYAVVRQTAGGVPGPRPVGQLRPNPLGLYDVHGNLWDWTSASTLRGGSWSDVLPQARSANRVILDRITPHALAGARLVFRPPTN
jgi:formylglycine-generating enzyme required for sulfatase activity